jgi:hypothetical protein
MLVVVGVVSVFVYALIPFRAPPVGSVIDRTGASPGTSSQSIAPGPGSVPGPGSSSTVPGVSVPGGSTPIGIQLSSPAQTQSVTTARSG